MRWLVLFDGGECVFVFIGMMFVLFFGIFKRLMGVYLPPVVAW